MGNMSYCRFRNTLIDLRECKDVLINTNLNEETEENELLDREEFSAALDMIEEIREIAEHFEDCDLHELREEYYKKLNK